MKQTAVEWFLTEFQKQVWFEPNSELDIWVKNLIPKAKEMEKEQIGKAFFEGILKEIGSGVLFDMQPLIDNYNNYYNETFNKSINNKG